MPNLEQDASDLEMLAKIVGILVAVIGCLVGVLTYLRGTGRPAPANEDANIRQQMVGTWFREQTLVGQYEEKMHVIERVDLYDPGSADTGRTVTTETYGRYLECGEPKFLCKGAIEGTWSIHGKLWTVRRNDTMMQVRPFLDDDREVSPEYQGENGFHCGAGTGVGTVSFLSETELSIESVSGNRLKVTFAQADSGGKYATAIYTRTQPSPSLLGKAWSSLCGFF